MQQFQNEPISRKATRLANKTKYILQQKWGSLTICQFGKRGDELAKHKAIIPHREDYPIVVDKMLQIVTLLNARKNLAMGLDKIKQTNLDSVIKHLQDNDQRTRIV
jgi:hypothetical protein